MKKYFLGVITGFIVCTMLVSTMAIANSPIKLIVNGAEVFSDVPPQIIDGRTMIPARPLAEALGAKVEWDAENSAVVVTGGVQVGAVPTDLEPVEENGKENKNVENVIVKKDEHIIVKDGIEYYTLYWINQLIYQKKYSIGLDLENKTAFVAHNKDEAISVYDKVKILDNIPYEVFEGQTHIKKEYYDSMILPTIK